MKNQKRPYWTQIQRESPLLFSPLLSPFPPSLGNSHECGKLSSRWTPLRARGTPDALLGRCLPPLLEMPCLPICKSHASSQGRKGKLRDWGEGEPKPNKQKTIFPQPPLPPAEVRLTEPHLWRRCSYLESGTRVWTRVGNV